MVLTGPSGAGKTSIIRAVLGAESSLSFSVSHTTRAQRAGEREGADYYFVARDAFLSLRDAGGFVEWAEVHGHLYGTSFAEIDRAVREGRDLLLDIDVQGAAQLAVRLPEAASVFLLPPDYGTLAARLRGRRSESEADVAGRLAAAVLEVRKYASFAYLVVNEGVEQAAGEIRAILAAERLRTARRGPVADRILATFPALPPGTGTGPAASPGEDGRKPER